MCPVWPCGLGCIGVGSAWQCRYVALGTQPCWDTHRKVGVCGCVVFVGLVCLVWQRFWAAPACTRRSQTVCGGGRPCWPPGAPQTVAQTAPKRRWVGQGWACPGPALGAATHSFAMPPPPPWPPASGPSLSTAITIFGGPVQPASWSHHGIGAGQRWGDGGAWQGGAGWLQF